MELKWILYITINQCNGKFYIGVHETNPDIFDGYIGLGIYRESDAKRKRRENNAFANAVIKYGYNNFKRTTIKIFPGTKEGKEMAYLYEELLVTETLIKSKQCYNTSSGGEMGGMLSFKRVYKYDISGNFLQSYSCAKEAALNLPNVENIISAKTAIKNCCLGQTKSAFGFVWSYEKRFSKKYNDGKKVAQYTMSGKFLRYWESVSKAEQELNIKNIHNVVGDKTPYFSAGNYRWKYFNGDSSDIEVPNFKNKFTYCVPIEMYDKNGCFLKQYNSVKDCVKENPNLKVSQITKVLKGTIKSSQGYKFKIQQVNDIV